MDNSQSNPQTDVVKIMQEQSHLGTTKTTYNPISIEILKD
jgi:hypothetical protein